MRVTSWRSLFRIFPAFPQPRSLDIVRGFRSAQQHRFPVPLVLIAFARKNKLYAAGIPGGFGSFSTSKQPTASPATSVLDVYLIAHTPNCSLCTLAANTTLSKQTCLFRKEIKKDRLERKKRKKYKKLCSHRPISFSNIRIFAHFPCKKRVRSGNKTSENPECPQDYYFFLFSTLVVRTPQQFQVAFLLL